TTISSTSCSVCANTLSSVCPMNLSALYAAMTTVTFGAGASAEKLLARAVADVSMLQHRSRSTRVVRGADEPKALGDIGRHASGALRRLHRPFEQIGRDSKSAGLLSNLV